MKYCALCQRMVEPKKRFSWLTFFLLLGVFYLPWYWLFGAKHCPICNVKF